MELDARRYSYQINMQIQRTPTCSCCTFQLPRERELAGLEHIRMETVSLVVVIVLVRAGLDCLARLSNLMVEVIDLTSTNGECGRV